MITLSDEELDRLSRALFKEQERMLPEGETWEDQNVGDIAYWHNSVMAVLSELEKIMEDR